MAKEVKMFVQATCPHCHNAMRMMDELRASNEKYKDVHVEIIDENRNPRIADMYDYWYVPTFFVDGQKVQEGVPSIEAVQDVFEKALEP